MSKFLAPIHTWLFNKIVLFEEIELEVIRLYEAETGKDIGAIVNANRAKYGELLPNEPIETLIDQSNIHGWLQAQINVVETRQAGIITDLIAADGGLNKSIAQAYENIAAKASVDLKGSAKTAGELNRVLSNFVLEGMPCDRVNTVLSETDDDLIWETTSCIHEKYWEVVGGAVETYYTLRTAFSKKLVSEINPAFEYTFTTENGMKHSIALAK